MSSIMQKLICITNRQLCQDDFLTRIEEISRFKPKAILLREKDLSSDEYEKIAKPVMNICKNEGVLCILHNFVETAIKLEAEAIHMTFQALRIMTAEQKNKFQLIGASCHSAEEARKAEIFGCNYIIAGHIFDTLSKKNLPARGLDFFKEIINNVTIPVYAIGGINADNVSEVINAGAKGVCMMSGPMQCENINLYMQKLKDVSINEIKT